MKANRRAILGLILVLIGSLLLAENLDLIPNLPRYLFSWPSIFILIGIVNLINGNRGPALIFILIGGFFFAQRYLDFDFDFDTYWPAILVIIGLAFILGRRNTSSGKPEIDDSYIDELNIFGASKKKITSKNLEGGKITNIFGGSDIDLTEASPIDGALIEIVTIFGGCDIIIPEHWDVRINTTSIFGGFEDNRPKSIAKSDYKVYIKGFTMFGAGDLKSSKG